MQRVAAFVLLILLSPIILIAGMVIAITSGVPIVFIQDRVGLNKKSFKIIKLRTMRNNQITFIGKVLRKTGIDELPQLLNIIQGEMAFVGPRPLTESDINRLEWNSDQYNSRWSVLPGITGMAQLTNVCDKNVSWQNDDFYIRNKSAKLDRKILWQSIMIPIIGKSKVKSTIHN